MSVERRKQFAHRTLNRGSRGWRLSRWLLVAWFAISSAGMSSSAAPAAGRRGPEGAGQICRCSVLKRMSGTCCCSVEEPKAASASCCSGELQQAERRRPRPTNCCKQDKPAPSELPRVSSCPCGADPGLVAGNPSPRLSATFLVFARSEQDVVLSDPPNERWADIALLPAVPPPKVLG